MQDLATTNVLGMTAEIVASFVSNNQVRSADLPDLVSSIHSSLMKIVMPAVGEEPAPELKPAVTIKKSVTDDYLICLDDGKKFKSLRRHLQTAYGMTPDDYRAKWGLPASYPMVAPGYAARRSELAKASGLGNQRRTPTAVDPEPVATTVAKRAPKAGAAAPAPADAAPAKRRGRPKKVA